MRLQFEANFMAFGLRRLLGNRRKIITMEIVTIIIVAFLTDIIRFLFIPAETGGGCVTPCAHVRKDGAAQCHGWCAVRAMHRSAHYP